MTKEQRHGIRMDLEQLRDFVREKMVETGELTTKGAVALKFDWSHAKLYTLFRMCAEAFDDIELMAGNLIYTES